MNNQEFSAFEEKIIRATQMPEPKPAFAETLWRDITARQRAPRPALSQRIAAAFARPAWSLTVAVVLALLIATTAIGPQRVLAALQGMLGYVPGVGFVNTDNGFALREPVEITRDGQTFRVEQLVLTDKETVVVLRIRGITLNEDVRLGDIFWLELPDGNTFLPNEYGTEYAGEDEFISVFKCRALPVGTRRLTVVWDPDGWQPGEGKPIDNEWRVDLRLDPVTDPAVAQILPVSYQPENAADTQLGVTLQVDQVSSGSSNFAARIQAFYPEEMGIAYSVYDSTLLDDRGGSYLEDYYTHFDDNGQPVRTIVPENDAQPALRNFHQTLEFPAIDPRTQRLTLNVGKLVADVHPDVAFTIDLGLNPVAGDSWPIDEEFSVGGLTFRVIEARLAQVTDLNGIPMTGLVLNIEPADAEHVEINQVWLTKSDDPIGFEEITRNWTVTWSSDDIPTGPVTVVLHNLRAILHGNWQIEWDHQQP